VPGTVAYLNFLNNALRFLPWIERHGLPFALTLYPGGGFGIGAPFSDNGLKRVLASPLLRHVIATQPITQLYLQDFTAAHGLALPPCTLISGGVASERYFAPDAPLHAPWFGEGKAVMDIAFVAEKYMPDGANKGWPAFVDALRALADRPQIRWHVVGGFGPDDLPAGEPALRERVRFHGRLETNALQRLLCGIDVVVSLSRPGVLHAGNFDGFPTGSAVEASLCGAAIVASDVLLQNPGYVDGESMCLVEPEGGAVAAALRALLAEPQRVGAIARAGQAFTREQYRLERQVAPRWQVLQALMRDGAAAFGSAGQAAA
jgi:lipopolysaccharide transport system ATP-binding protein